MPYRTYTLKFGIIVPHCYGGNIATGLIVLEDLGDQPSLRDVLSSNNGVQAEEAIIQYFATLGILHARSYGYGSRFHALRSSFGSYDPTLDWYW